MCWAFDSTPFVLAWMMHKVSTVVPPSAALTELRFLVLLDLLHEKKGDSLGQSTFSEE